MKLKEFLSGIPGHAPMSVVSNGWKALRLVNQFLQPIDKLRDGSTAGELRAVIGSLPDDQKNSLLEKDFDLQITESNNWRDIMEFHAEADKTGNSTRPKNASRLTITVIVISLGYSFAILKAILFGEVETLKALHDNWQIISSLIFVLIMPVLHYFGKRSADKQARYAASHGQPIITGVAQLINSIRGR